MTSFLLPASPIGFGTAEVECFSSYFPRLAQVNGVSAGQLVKIISRVTGRKGLDNESGRATGSMLRRTTSKLSTLIGATQELSGVRGLTMLSFLAAAPRGVSVSQHSLRSQRAWCEQCIQEDLRMEVPPHDRLLWSCEFIIRCPFHRILLRTSCPSCSLRQERLPFDADAAHCIHCNSLIVGPSAELIPELKPFFGEYELVELVSAIASGHLTSTAQDCLDVFFTSLRKFGLSSSADRVESTHLLGRVQGWAPTPTIASLVGTASKYSVPIILLITDPSAAARQAANLGIGLQSAPGRSRLKVESQLMQSVRVTLERGLKASDDDVLPTFAQMGATFSLRSLDFASAFPDLSEQYMEKIRRQARRSTGRL